MDSNNYYSKRLYFFVVFNRLQLQCNQIYVMYKIEHSILVYCTKLLAIWKPYALEDLQNQSEKKKKIHWTKQAIQVMAIGSKTIISKWRMKKTQSESKRIAELYVLLLDGFPLLKLNSNKTTTKLQSKAKYVTTLPILCLNGS